MNQGCRGLKKFLVLIPFIFGSHIGFSQIFVQNLADFFEFEFNKKDTSRYTKKLVIAPIISLDPSSSLGFGLGTKLLFKPKKAGLDTRTSNIPISAKYTLNNQFILNSRYTIFLPQENWLLKGNLGFSKFPISFFGLGNESLFENERKIESNNGIVESLFFKHIKKKWFAGGGIRYVTNYRVNVETLNDNDSITNALKQQIDARSVGITMALTKDSRDNVLNALNGSFVELTHGFYGGMFGSTNNYMLTKLDMRKYFRVKPNKLNIIAIQAYMRAAWGNEIPLLELSGLGGAELLRGYQENRFLDNYAYFGQAEYRWQAFDLIGFVFFAGMGDVFAENQKLSLNSMKYSLGTGLRLKIVKSENLNIRLDYAWGLGDEIDNNFYLGIAESF